MTCGSCVARVKERLLSIEGVQSAEIQLASPQARLTTNKSLSLDQLNQKLGHYVASNLKGKKTSSPTVLPEISVTTYRPLILIVSFIIGVTLLSQYPFDAFSWKLWMRNFMAGFFIVFAFFKLLNLSGFASSYAMYDLIAKNWKGWGYIYPFVELGLGVLYLINVFPVYTNVATILILGVSSIGVIQSVLSKQKIKCACLGDVFQLPMSTVTIIEDVGMVLMAAFMLFAL